MLPRTMLNLQGRAFYQLMSFSCAMAFLIFGYDAGVLGGVQTTQPFLSGLNITGNEQGNLIIPLIASSYTLGCLVMAIFLVISGVGYHFGRRMSILIGDVLVVIGGAIQASSFSVAQIITARVICGFGIGLISATVPTYMSETTIKTSQRGPQVAIQCVYLIWGVALAYWVDLGMTQLDSQASWRFPISLQSLFTLLSFVGMLVLPDTPRWYYSKGRIEDGDRVLSQLYALPIEDEQVQKTRAEILETIKLEDQEGRIKVLDFFWDRSKLQSARRVRTSFLILSLQQNMAIGCWMGCPWLYGPEIAPLRYRHLGGAAGIVGEWSMTFATVFGGGIAVQSVGWPIWFWQLTSCVVAVIFVYFWCPETAGKTLEEIDDVFIEEAQRWPGAKHIRVHEEELSVEDSRSGKGAKYEEVAEHEETV
ncbi:MFS general substrate transporter [Lecanosticta acicola]|uniref:MFS general substrate transporter n=1 Tax=Lecanosticta acicola TaxID=111012 RepID=A0AAI8YXU7_9PEZI|nr:MFS general substrate transporter [Lecanosticta acicola]